MGGKKKDHRVRCKFHNQTTHRMSPSYNTQCPACVDLTMAALHRRIQRLEKVANDG